MKRQISFVALAALFVTPAVWADRATRAERTRAEMARVTTPVPITEEARALVRSRIAGNGPGLRERKLAVRGATARAAGEQQVQNFGQAPGVTQINLFDLGRESYFVATETLRVGTTVQAFLIQPDLIQEWGLEALRVNEDLPPGFSFYLPAIRTLGDFWQKGLTTYMVVVTLPDGTQTMSNVDYGTKGYARDAKAVSDYLWPGINSWREFSSGDGSLMLEIKGRFYTDKRTYVVLEDQVVPQGAIQVLDSETIWVNLSSVPTFDPTVLLGYQLTVGQGGWCDNLPFRHTPR